MSACVPVPRGLLHLLLWGAVRGCLVWPRLLPRPATPGWGVGACVCLCALPACTPPFLAGVCCVGVRAGLGFRLCPAPLCWVVGVCMRSCVCPACPRPSWGAACGAGVCGCCRWWGLPPPLPFGFVFGGGGRRDVSCLGFVVSVAGCPGLGSRGLCPPIPSLPGRVDFFFRPSMVCVCVFWVLISWWAAATGWVLPVFAGWSPGAPLGGPVFGAVGVGGLAAFCGVGGLFGGCGPFSRPPPLLFFLGGVCLFLPLPSLGWHRHWLAFSVVFRVAVGGCVLPGRAPVPWVGWVMYTLGSAPLPARLGCGSAGWAVAPGGFVWPWISVSFRLRCAGFNFLAAACVGRPPPLLLCVCWPLAGVWRAGAAPSGACGGLFWLDPRLASLALVLWCAVVRRAALCRVSPCCVASVRAVLRCALLGRAVLRSAAPWCAALCRVASRRAVACCALWCLVVVRCTVARCGAVCRAASCCSVVDRWRSVWPVSWCGVRVRVWVPGGWGVQLGVGGSLGPCCGGLGVPLGLVGRVGVRGAALPGGLCRGPVCSQSPGP